MARDVGFGLRTMTIADYFHSDVASFGSLQALPSFLNQFGTLQPDGSYGLSTTRKSLMNSGERLTWLPRAGGEFLLT